MHGKAINFVVLLFVAVAERSLAPNCEQRSKVVGSIPSNFSTRPVCKKINYVPSVRVAGICKDHRLLCQDSFKGVDRALTLSEPILHNIIIIDRKLPIPKLWY